MGKFPVGGGVRQFYAPRDHFTAEEITKLAGTASIPTLSKGYQGMISPYAREVSAGGPVSSWVNGSPQMTQIAFRVSGI